MKVALTGGICSGKTTVAALFQQRGWAVYSLDEVARKHYYEPEVKKSLQEYFGEDIYLSDGSLDRKRLASIVFSDPEKLRLLDSVFLPVFKEFVLGLRGEFILVEGAVIGKSLPPEIGEFDLLPLFDVVIFVDRPLNKQLECVIGRYSLPRERALERIKSQPLDRVRALSDFVIMNHFSKEELLRVSAFLADFLKRAV